MNAHGGKASKDSDMTDKTIGVIGLGRMGLRHVEAARLAGFHVGAVHDPFPDAFGFAQEPDLRAIACATSGELFDKRLDLVVVATTAPAHLPLVLEGLQRGARRFVVEKPLTSDPAEALEMARMRSPA